MSEVDVEERIVKLSHGDTHYLEAGDGEPIILLHGVGFWHGGDYWLPNIHSLATKYKVYAPDFVGWGNGDRLDIEYSFAYLVDFVREFQDALGISSSHVIGHSMGGWVAALLAYESPNRVRTLTLVGSGGMAERTLSTMTSFKPPAMDDILNHILKTSTLRGSDAMNLARRWYHRTQLPGALESYQRILKHMNHPVNRARYGLRRRLPHIECPILVVWGDEDDVNDLELGKALHALLPHSEMVILPGGHFIPSEKPDDFNRRVMEFLAKHVER
ncbi:MAG: alpha/beta hydrolase [Alicyclobacillus herbarius]|uniref:alpha/beta fold hydrolase n=1 Tax=Alicyclobacillus herbarius TaxID=122960 RepID=UPI0023561345|nr:alpha/beta hydrolase [Alicyclobacillus herbarius]MCL6633191.1 alpha/beta hydrolase [Alicyclobacillus herbarius]